MNMTPEQQAQWRDACEALLAGEDIQLFSELEDRWINTRSITAGLLHRRKPKPDPDPLAAVKAAHAAGLRIEARQYPTESHAWHHVEDPNWSLDFEWRAVLWTLPPPPAGQEWHRTDWTEDMLPDGWRPLLDGEIPQFGDQVWEFGKGPWGKYVTAEPRHSAHNHTRTMRPLPTPPRMVPLGPAISRCCTCGAEWLTGEDGSHSCAVHLNRRLATIRARCVLFSQQDYRPDTSLPAGLPSPTVAMALTCIAAIDACQPITEENLPLVQSILDAWE